MFPPPRFFYKQKREESLNRQKFLGKKKTHHRTTSITAFHLFQSQSKASQAIILDTNTMSTVSPIAASSRDSPTKHAADIRVRRRPRPSSSYEQENNVLNDEMMEPPPNDDPSPTAATHIYTNEKIVRPRNRKTHELRSTNEPEKRGGVTWTPSTSSKEHGEKVRGEDYDNKKDYDYHHDEDEGSSSMGTDIIVKNNGWGCGGFLIPKGSNSSKRITGNDDEGEEDTSPHDDARKAHDDFSDTGTDTTDGAQTMQSEVKSEASMMVLGRYLGLSSKPYNADSPFTKALVEEESDIKFTHELQVGDHVIRWRMIGYLYPLQVHGIVFSVGPDVVTIVDCGLSPVSQDKVGPDDDKTRKKKTEPRRRMQIVTIDDETEIKKWTKIRYGEEVQLQVHSSNEEMHDKIKENNVDVKLMASAAQDGGGLGNDAPFEGSTWPSAGLNVDEVQQCNQAKISKTPENESKTQRSWFSWRNKNNSPKTKSPSQIVDEDSTKQQEKQKLRLPETDPVKLVLARLRFLLEYGEEPFPPSSPGSLDDAEKDYDVDDDKLDQPNLLPPHHLLYANSECIAVYCKTGKWSTIQAAIFLKASSAGNVKLSATIAMFLGAQTVQVPASGLFGWLGGTTALPLFTAQPWLVPALVGGGMVYVGLPMLMLWKAKGRWAETESRLNDSFWSMYETDLIVEMIRTFSGLKDPSCTSRSLPVKPRKPALKASKSAWAAAKAALKELE